MNPTIKVGIIEAAAISIVTNGRYSINGHPLTDTQTDFSFSDGQVRFNGHKASSCRLEPAEPDATVTIRNVMIGIGFHWQRQEDQQFKGSFIIIPSSRKIIAINEIDIEQYLQSVIASEMNANAPQEFLKAHAVISRSWALAQIGHKQSCAETLCSETEEETVKWYDHSAHTLFDVCADDHCQRYQGFTKASTTRVKQAVTQTCGIVLTHEGHLCDARFSKCCGGITERFSTCWQPLDKPYLQAVTDAPGSHTADMSSESDARKWITAQAHDSFCANPPENILASILNTCDRSTPHLYRWRTEYTAEELREIIHFRSGIDYGRIVNIQPLHRGPSGRIDRLRIAGTCLTRIIGKELEIRRTLSRSHLYSSAFIVEKHDMDSDGIPSRWTLHGAGWGHGVGLCQTGAAVMAAQGYDYRQILAHYFPGAEATHIY